MSSDKKVAISVKGITKSFRIPLDKGVGVKSKILGRATRGYREFTPLKDITFDIYEGDFFGIVGRNGSGKSTLLKTIAGIYEPTAGRVKVDGTLVPFIELGVGFNPNLTGRENVYLNAALLGFSRDETDDMYEDIVDFAELHDFMEERLQNYSSGMQVRLAFSIAIRAKGDILLLDEVLAVGDQAFQQKCFDYFEQLKDENKTVILVTHSMSNVERFCTRAMLIKDGSIEHIGEPSEVAAKYKELFVKQKDADGAHQDVYSGRYELDVSRVEIYQYDKNTVDIVAMQPFKAKFSLKSYSSELGRINPVLNIEDSKGNKVYMSDMFTQTGEFLNLGENEIAEIEYEITENIYTNGKYNVYVHASIDDGGRRRARAKTVESRFNIDGIKNKNTQSVVHPATDVKVRKQQAKS